MKIGDIIKVNGKLATIISENYTRMVYDDDDRMRGGSGYDSGSACSFFDVIYNGSAKKESVNMSRTKVEFV